MWLVGGLRSPSALVLRFNSFWISSSTHHVCSTTETPVLLGQYLMRSCTCPLSFQVLIEIWIRWGMTGKIKFNLVQTRLGQLGANISPDRSSLTPQVLIGNFLKHNYPLLYELQHINLLCLYLPKKMCIPRRRIHNSNYIFNLPAMITLNLFSKYLLINDWWLNVHSKIIIPKEHISFYICWQIKYYF